MLKKFVDQMARMVVDEDCPIINPYNDFEYKISSEGRDFVKDGENSGIYHEYPEIFFVGSGFCFILLQLFV